MKALRKVRRKKEIQTVSVKSKEKLTQYENTFILIRMHNLPILPFF